ncbi:hypothetical protein [Mesorhizobium sp. M0578]|uniref:hypothetical protein n=1 Tax=unclassified Mesorhizobium TaxID=325217 RepID=UPI00333CB8E4
MPFVYWKGKSNEAYHRKNCSLSRGWTGRHRHQSTAQGCSGKASVAPCHPLWRSGSCRHGLKEGDVFPLIITKVWGDTETSAFNGQLMLDGNDLFWVTSTAIGEGNRQCFWPPREEPKVAAAA